MRNELDRRGNVQPKSENELVEEKNEGHGNGGSGSDQLKMIRQGA